MPARLLEHPLAELDDDAGLLGVGDELHRRDHPALRVLPAGKCLEAREPAALERDDRLVDDLELLLADRLPQILAPLKPRRGLVVHLLVEDLVAVLAARLGVVHGGVGVVEQVLGPLRRRLLEGDADARGGLDLVALDVERPRHGLLEALHHHSGVGAGPDAVQQHHELVAAEPRDRVALEPRDAVGLAQGIVEALGDPDEQLVAHEVSQAVVDLLELVDVHEEHREVVLLASAGTLYAPFQAVDEKVAVAQARQLVVEGRVPKLLLGPASHADLAFQVLLLPLHLGRPLPHLGVEGVHEGGEDAGERFELLGRALFETREDAAALAELHRGLGQPPHGGDELARGPVANALDDGQIGETDDPHHDHDEAAPPAQRFALAPGDRGRLPLHEGELPGVHRAALAEVLQLVGMLDALRARGGELTGLLQSGDRALDEVGAGGRGRPLHDEQVGVGPLDRPLDDDEGLLGRARIEGVDGREQLLGVGDQGPHLVVLVGGPARVAGGLLEAAQQHAHRHREADRCRDRDGEDDREMVVNAHGAQRERASTMVGSPPAGPPHGRRKRADAPGEIEDLLPPHIGIRGRGLSPHRRRRRWPPITLADVDQKPPSRRRLEPMNTVRAAAPDTDQQQTGGTPMEIPSHVPPLASLRNPHYIVPRANAQRHTLPAPEPGSKGDLARGARALVHNLRRATHALVKDLGLEGKARQAVRELYSGFDRGLRAMLNQAVSATSVDAGKLEAAIGGDFRAFVVDLADMLGQVLPASDTSATPSGGLQAALDDLRTSFARALGSFLDLLGASRDDAGPAELRAASPGGIGGTLLDTQA